MQTKCIFVRLGQDHEFGGIHTHLPALVPCPRVWRGSGEARMKSTGCERPLCPSDVGRLCSRSLFRINLSFISIGLAPFSYVDRVDCKGLFIAMYHTNWKSDAQRYHKVSVTHSNNMPTIYGSSVNGPQPTRRFSSQREVSPVPNAMQIENQRVCKTPCKKWRRKKAAFDRSNRDRFLKVDQRLFFPARVSDCEVVFAVRSLAGYLHLISWIDFLINYRAGYLRLFETGRFLEHLGYICHFVDFLFFFRFVKVMATLDVFCIIFFLSSLQPDVLGYGILPASVVLAKRKSLFKRCVESSFSLSI